MKKRHITDPLAQARKLEQERLERERQEMIMAQNDISVISLDNNIENSYIGQGAKEPEPEVLYTKEAKRVVRSLNHLETRRVMLVNTVVGTGSVGRLVEGLYNTLTANGYECTFLSADGSRWTDHPQENRISPAPRFHGIPAAGKTAAAGQTVKIFPQTVTAAFRSAAE